MEARSTSPDEDANFTVPATTVYCNQGLPPFRAPTPTAVMHNLAELHRAEVRGIEPQPIEQSNPQGE